MCDRCSEMTVWVGGNSALAAFLWSKITSGVFHKGKNREVFLNGGCMVDTLGVTAWVGINSTLAAF